MSVNDGVASNDQETVGGEPAGVPVGHAGARVDISERRAWTVDGVVGLLVLVVLAGIGIWLIVLAAV